jgi:hypothetical protein
LLFVCPLKTTTNLLFDLSNTMVALCDEPEMPPEVFVSNEGDDQFTKSFEYPSGI